MKCDQYFNDMSQQIHIMMILATVFRTLNWLSSTCLGWLWMKCW